MIRHTTEESIIVNRCAEAMSRLSDAIKYPLISRSAIVKAIEYLGEAKLAAEVIDPEEEQ